MADIWGDHGPLMRFVRAQLVACWGYDGGQPVKGGGVGEMEEGGGGEREGRVPEVGGGGRVTGGGSSIYKMVLMFKTIYCTCM